MAAREKTGKKTDAPDLKGLRAMPSLGKASAELLVDVGITTPEKLREVGAIEAWRRLRFAHGKRVTITWVYALDIAIKGIPWKELSETRAARLSAAAQAILAEIEPPKPGRSAPLRRGNKGRSLLKPVSKRSEPLAA